jgi:phosphoserine phosphatase
MSEAPASASSPDQAPCLLTLSGKDRPGVTAAVFSALAPSGVDVLEVQQVVVGGHLMLALLLQRPAPEALHAVESVARELGLSTEVDAPPGDSEGAASGRSHVTVLGFPLTSGALADCAHAIAALDGNIERIHPIARYPVTAIELEVSGADPARLRQSLARIAVDESIDVAVQAAGLHRRGKRVVVMDVDSTLVRGEVVEMLAARAGCEAEVAAITERAMKGELDFVESLTARVAMLEGLPESVFDDVAEDLELMPGARTLIRTLRRLGYRTAIVSGGFTRITDRLVADLGLDHARANVLEVVDGRLTGRIVGDVVDRAAKADFLRQVAEREGVPMEATVAIGDGANDLDMIAAAGLGVAFNAKPVVREAADTSLTVPYLDSILYLLGITRTEIEAADAREGTTTPAPAVDRAQNR